MPNFIPFLKVPEFSVEKATNNRNFTSTILNGGCEVFVPVSLEAQIPTVKKQLIEFSQQQNLLLTPDLESA